MMFTDNVSNVDVSAIDPHLSDASDSDDLPAPHLPEKFRPDPNDMLLMPNYEPDKRGTRSKDAASSPRPSKAAPASPGALSRFLQSLVEPVPGDRAASLYVGSLCLVQALWILSGIMVTSYLPLYLKDSLQLSMGRIGQLESFSMLAQKVFNFGSGIMGDLWDHKRLMVFGAVLFAAGRPMFAATGWVHAAAGAAGVLWWVSMARLLDKVTKGFRDTPMKALIAKVTGPNKAAALASKAAYQTLANAFGCVAASLIFAASGASYVTCFTIAIVPAVLAGFICAGLPEDKEEEAEERATAAAPAKVDTVPAKHATPTADPAAAAKGGSWIQRNTRAFTEWASKVLTLPGPYWQAAAAFSVLYLARFEPSFVSIRVASVGVDRVLVPTLVAMSMLINGVSGKLSGAWVSCADLAGGRPEDIAREHVKRRNVAFAIGYAAFLGAHATFGLASNALGMWAGWALVGLHMGLTHSLIGATLQSYAPDSLSGTAFSIFDIISAGFLFFGNLWAGQLSDATVAAGMGPVGCFGMGFAACAVSGVMLLAAVAFGGMGRPELVNLGKLAKRGKSAQAS